MAVSEAGLRNYITLPPDSTEDLNLYLAAAKGQLRTAGVPDYESNAQYDLCVYALAAMHYDNRGMSFSGAYQATAEDNASKLINSFVLQLRHAGNDPEVIDP